MAAIFPIDFSRNWTDDREIAEKSGNVIWPWQVVLQLLYFPGVRVLRTTPSMFMSILVKDGTKADLIIPMLCTAVLNIPGDITMAKAACQISLKPKQPRMPQFNHRE